jgi:hypothetical protein
MASQGGRPHYVKHCNYLVLEASLIKMKSLKLLAIVLTGLWLSACTHTGSPVASKPEKEETEKSTNESRATSPDATESNSQETQQKAPDSPVGSQAATSPDQKKAGENTRISPTAYPDATKPKQEEAGRATSADAANSKLEEARENLRTSQETEKRIASELEHLKKSGNASAEAIQDYEEYLARVRAMTTENRKIVERMEAAYTRHSPGKPGPNPTAANKLDKMYDPNIPEEQTVDEVAALDRELNQSLAKFDDRLLKEMDAIRAESAKKLQDLAQEAADAAKRLRDKGLDVDTTGSKSSEEAGAQKEEPESSRETETTGDTADTETASRDGSRKGGQGASANDRHRTDYKDDDIVARQLREAAENEKDPELKEKLWKEYEEYKKSR